MEALAYHRQAQIENFATNTILPEGQGYSLLTQAKDLAATQPKWFQRGLRRLYTEHHSIYEEIPSTAALMAREACLEAYDTSYQTLIHSLKQLTKGNPGIRGTLSEGIIYNKIGLGTTTNTDIYVITTPDTSFIVKLLSETSEPTIRRCAEQVEAMLRQRNLQHVSHILGYSFTDGAIIMTQAKGQDLFQATDQDFSFTDENLGEFIDILIENSAAQVEPDLAEPNIFWDDTTKWTLIDPLLPSVPQDQLLSLSLARLVYLIHRTTHKGLQVDNRFIDWVKQSAIQRGISEDVFTEMDRFISYGEYFL